MSDTPRISMRKAGSGADPSGRPAPPRFVVLAAAAMVISGVSAMVASLDLYGLKGWLLDTSRTANRKLKTDKQLTDLKLHQNVDQAVKAQLIATIILLVSLAFVAMAAYRGRYWARWGTVGLWVLASFTGTLAGLSSVLAIAVSAPMGYKLPAFISGAMFVVAIVLVNLRPSVQYFHLSRPVKAGGAPARRGLFSPRTRPSAGTGSSARTGSGTQPTRNAQTAPLRRPPVSAEEEGQARARAKQRANAEAVAKGAELARSRAKAASKSRRTGV